MERIVNLARSFEEADDWDIRQCLAMTPDERMAAARALKERLYPDAEDVRDCLRDVISRRSSGSSTPTE